jgi:hypothetical protein
MVATIANNPFVTTQSQGLFLPVTPNGLVQGTAYPDPAIRNALRRGVLAATETLPMWGGVAIYENIPGTTGGPNQALGVTVGRATSILGGSSPIAGWSVFDQAYGMVNSPASPVPLAPSYGQVNSYRLGSGARIAVACDPGLVSLFGTGIGSYAQWANIKYGAGSGGQPLVTWDLVNQLLAPYVGATAISSGTYNTATGLVTLTMASPVNISPGTSVIVSGATGTGSFASINGTQTAGAGSTGSTVTYTVATGLTMTITGGSLNTGAGTVPVSVLEVQPINCMTVTYASGTNTAAWNFNGAAAIIQI